MNGRVILFCFILFNIKKVDINEEKREENIWVSPINLVMSKEKKDFRLSFQCFGVEEGDSAKIIFWVENLNLYVK